MRVKVCGLTSAEDAVAAAGIGADFLGFILYPKSPRYLPLEQFVALRERLPALPKVAVLVQPTPPELAAARAAGFDFFQIHFPVTGWMAVRRVAATVGAERLWLAPKLPPDADLAPELLALADTWLFDTYRADSFGGTGHTGDWAKFRRYRETQPTKRWILAGGLSPENAAAAVAATGAETLDVNSGVESSPGRKDPAKLAALRTALER
ncbi:MAG: phosphoribosylanthranilate isomerase [Opitutaceae bacterium]